MRNRHAGVKSRFVFDQHCLLWRLIWVLWAWTDLQTGCNWIHLQPIRAVKCMTCDLSNLDWWHYSVSHCIRPAPSQSCDWPDIGQVGWKNVSEHGGWLDTSARANKTWAQKNCLVPGVISNMSLSQKTRKTCPVLSCWDCILQALQGLYEPKLLENFPKVKKKHDMLTF